MQYIDIHVHHPWWNLSNRPEYGLSRLKSLAVQSNIGRVLLLTMGVGRSPQEVQERNECTLRLLQEDPAFYLGAMYLSPNHDPAFNRQEAARCVKGGMVAIKQSIEVNARDNRCDVIAEIAGEQGIPILFHSWYKVVQKYENESDPSDIAFLAKRHPDTKFIVAHLTGGGRRGVQDIEDLPNVWVDTCGGWYDSELVEYAVRHMGEERVLYGSDYSGRDYAAQVGRVLGARLSDEQKEKIMWKNAENLLQLR